MDCRHDCKRLDLPECESLWRTNTICTKENWQTSHVYRFQALNSNKKLDIFLLPCISDLLDRLGHATVFSSIDLAHTY